MSLHRWFLALGLFALAVAMSGLGLMVLAANADERIDGPLWMDWLIEQSRFTPLGLAYRLEAFVSVAGLFGLGFLTTALVMHAWRRRRMARGM